MRFTTIHLVFAASHRSPKKQDNIDKIYKTDGCGKSTLAKHFNALLRLQNGRLTVAGTEKRKCAFSDKFRNRLHPVCFFRLIFDPHR